jgi:hypothetical protein
LILAVVDIVFIITHAKNEKLLVNSNLTQKYKEYPKKRLNFAQ